MIRPLAACLLAWAAAACTKVNEQPVLPPAEPAPPPAVKEVKRPPPPRQPWRSAFADEAPARPRPAAPATPDAGPRIDTLNGDPNGLKREDLQKVLDGAMPAFARCFEKSERSLTVSLSFDAAPEGAVTNLQVSGGEPAHDGCVKGVASGLRIPSFQGTPVPVSFPLSIHASPRPKAAAPPAPAAPEPARPAPVFVNP